MSKLPKPQKPKFEPTPALVMGCSVAMLAWMFFMGLIMIGLKMSAGSH